MHISGELYHTDRSETPVLTGEGQKTKDKDSYFLV